MIGKRVIKAMKMILHGVFFCVGFYVIYNVLFEDNMSFVQAIEFTIIVEFVNILTFTLKILIQMIKRSRNNLK